MKNTFFTLVCIFLFIGSAHAQVRINVEPATGAFDLADLYNFRISNFVPTEFEYILYTDLKDASGNILYSATSEVITCPRGSTAYTIESFTDINPIINEFDFSKHNGEVEATLRLLHPIDHSSIIARDIRQINLKNGLVVDENGEVIINERLININPEYRYGTFFTLNDIFKVSFKNENGFEICRDLNIVIKNNEGQAFYKGEIKDFCLPEGEINLTEADKNRLEVINDNYENRTTSGSLRLEYSFSDTEVRGSANIDLFMHYKFSDKPQPYIFEGLNIAVSYPEKAQIHYAPTPDDVIIHMDENEELLEIETIDTGNRGMTWGINEAYGFELRRNDINGAIGLGVVNNQLIDGKPIQMSLYGIEKDNYKEFTLKDFTIYAPVNLYKKENHWLEATRSLHRTIAYLEYAGKIMTFSMFTVHGLETGAAEPISHIDALNSLEINGYKFIFSYDQNNIIQDVKITNGISTPKRSKNAWNRIIQNFVNDAIRYQEKLKQRQLYSISPERNVEMAKDSMNADKALIAYTIQKKIGYDSKSEDLVTFSNEEMQLSFGCHEGRFFGGTLENIVEHTFSYQYDPAKKIILSVDGYLAHKPHSIFPKGTKPQKGTIKGKTIFIHSNPEGLPYSAVAGKYERMEFGVEKIKALVSWLSDTAEEGKEAVRTFSFGDINIVTPVKRNSYLSNNGKKYNLTLFYDDNHIWLVRILGGFNYEISDILNSVKVKNKQFEFSYHGNELIEITER